MQKRSHISDFNVLPAFTFFATFCLAFSVFLSFSSENAGDFFYETFYFGQLALCVFCLTLNKNAILCFVGRKEGYFTLIGLSVVTFALWNFLITADYLYSILIVLSSFVGIVLYLLSATRRTELELILKSLIMLNVGVLMWQYLIYFLSGELVYFHSEMFPFSRDRYALTIGDHYARFSGFHLEPGSYANMVALILIFYHRLVNKIDLFFIVGTLSIVFTFSTIGFIMAMLLFYCILREIHWNLRKTLCLTCIFACVFLSFQDKAIGIFKERYFGNRADSSLSYKTKNMNIYLKLPLAEKITGVGVEVSAHRDNTLRHLTGNGALFYLIITLGLLGLSFSLLSLWLASSHGPTVVTFLILLFVSRYSVIYPAFWAILPSLWMCRGIKAETVRCSKLSTTQ